MLQRLARRMRLWVITTVAALAVPCGCGEEMTDMTVTLLTTGRNTAVENAIIEGDRLWIRSEVLFGILDVELVGNTLCRGSRCVPAPTNDGWSREKDGRTLVELGSIAGALTNIGTCVGGGGC